MKEHLGTRGGSVKLCRTCNAVPLQECGGLIHLSCLPAHRLGSSLRHCPYLQGYDTLNPILAPVHLTSPVPFGCQHLYVKHMYTSQWCGSIQLEMLIKTRLWSGTALARSLLLLEEAGVDSRSQMCTIPVVTASHVLTSPTSPTGAWAAHWARSVSTCLAI